MHIWWTKWNSVFYHVIFLIGTVKINQIFFFSLRRPPNLSKDDKVELENKEPEDMCGKHFLFDNKCKALL